MQIGRLILRRTFQASATELFQAFVSAEALKEWWSPEGFVVVAAQVDARVGGQYSLVMRSQTDSHVVYVRGLYREITPPTKLVFTHVFAAGSTYPPFAAAGLVGHETVVTVELYPARDGTELVLVQEQLPTPAADEQVRIGWEGIFEKLAGYVGKAGHNDL
jgi:uncharacterized protein YndB with AHSA1/START domain